MTVDQVEELLRKYVSTGVAVALILIGPATAPGSSAKPQAITVAPESSTTSAPVATSDPTTTETPTPTRPKASDGTTAAAKYDWGTPNREDDFSGDLSGWGLYDGVGHAGNGKRSPSAATVANGVLTIRGDAQGTTEGMAWDNGKGQKYGRWEGRVKAPASDPTYNALLLLWPDAENFPMGGEIDFMEMTDDTRQSTNSFVHHGADNAQVHGEVKIDATQWHNWAVEWTPKGVTTYLDGKTWWHTGDTAILPPGPMHLCIQLDWFPKDGGAAVKPSQMQVDWVRQYPVDGSGAPQETTAKPTTTPHSAPSKPQGSEMRDVIRRMFGW
jgi:hypothetical protein